MFLPVANGVVIMHPVRIGAAVLILLSFLAPVGLPARAGPRTGSPTDDLRRVLPAFRAMEVDLPRGRWDYFLCAPGGRQLVAASHQAGDPPGTWRIVLLTDRGSPLHELGRRPYAVTRLGWGRSRGNVLVAEEMTIWSLPVRGGEERPVTFPGLPRWNADGSCYVVEEEEGFRRFTRRGQPIGSLVTGALSPAWSPSGQWLAYPQRRVRPPGIPAAEWSPTCEVRLLEARRQTPRVAWSWAAWKREQTRRRWTWASGPRSVFWTPDGRSLVGLIQVRERGKPRSYLCRLGLVANTLALLPVAEHTAVLAASPDWRAWLVRLEGRLYLLRFAPPARGATR